MSTPAIKVIPDKQLQQAKHNKPRVGATHNPYTSPLGRLFQETVKYGIEKAIKAVRKPLIRYKANGDKKLAASAMKNPDLVFKYDDPLFQIINDSLKKSAREYLRDNDKERKQDLVCQTFDLILTVAHEDIYYRALMKKTIYDLIQELAKHPEYLEFDKMEMFIDCVFNGFDDSQRGKEAEIRKKAFMRAYQEYYETPEYFEEMKRNDRS